jgi:hypothetical protein
VVSLLILSSGHTHNTCSEHVSLCPFTGFGSLVVENPGRLTHRIIKAVKAAGIRAVIQRGWGGLGTGLDEPMPDSVLIIGACPHDWLFPKYASGIHVQPWLLLGATPFCWLLLASGGSCMAALIRGCA